jgi:hypothetical protein
MWWLLTEDVVFWTQSRPCEICEYRTLIKRILIFVIRVRSANNNFSKSQRALNACMREACHLFGKPVKNNPYLSFVYGLSFS